MDAKINQTKDGSSEDSSSDSESSSSESSSGFGLNKKAKAKSSKPKPKKPKTQAAAEVTEGDDKKNASPATPAPQSMGASTEPPASNAFDIASGIATPASSRGGGDSKSVGVLMDKATAALSHLKEVTPSAMLNQTIKQRDIDSRVQRAVDMVTKLEARTSESSALEKAAQINTEVNRVSQENELVRAVQSSPETVLVDNSDALRSMVAGMSGDEHLVFLTDIAKRLVEAGPDWVA